MTRLEKYRELFRDTPPVEQVEWPEDCAVLMDNVPELAGFSYPMIEAMWGDFSDVYYAAGHMILSEGLIEEFRESLLAESVPQPADSKCRKFPFE